MIQRKSDYVTLFYIDQNGQEISATPATWGRYAQMLAIQTAQQAAVTEDTQALSTYHTLLGDYQTLVNGGGSGTPPALPLHKNVDDATGAVTFSAFQPPLPVAVVPVMKVVPTATSGFGTAPDVPQDRTDVLIGLVMELLGDIKAIRAKLGA